MTSVTAIQRELEINRVIDDQLNEILRQMQSLLDASRIWESDMEVSQIQNLLAVAYETNSVEVVKNYIRYQIGRDRDGKSWRRPADAKPVFGDQIVNELDKLQKVAAGIVPKDSSQMEVDQTWMKLTRLYLGYLRRYFYYKKRGEKKRGRNDNQ
jgi:hypothetical protein